MSTTHGAARAPRLAAAAAPRCRPTRRAWRSPSNALSPWPANIQTTFLILQGIIAANLGFFAVVPGTFVVNKGTFAATLGTFVIVRGIFVVNQGTFAVNQGTFVVNQGTFDVNQGTFVIVPGDCLASIGRR